MHISHLDAFRACPSDVRHGDTQNRHDTPAAQPVICGHNGLNSSSHNSQLEPSARAATLESPTVALFALAVLVDPARTSRLVPPVTIVICACGAHQPTCAACLHSASLGAVGQISQPDSTPGSPRACLLNAQWPRSSRWLRVLRLPCLCVLCAYRDTQNRHNTPAAQPAICGHNGLSSSCANQPTRVKCLCGHPRIADDLSQRTHLSLPMYAAVPHRWLDRDARHSGLKYFRPQRAGREDEPLGGGGAPPPAHIIADLRAATDCLIVILFACAVGPPRILATPTILPP